jgi:hypothetical protein
LVGEAFFVLELRAIWFYIYHYRLDNGVLLVYDPVLHTRRSIALDDVAFIRSFYLLQGSADRSSKVGHELQTSNGDRVRLSEALRLWEEIMSICANAPLEELRKPWWVNVS